MLVHSQLQHRVQRGSLGGQLGVEGLGLGDGTGETVEQVAPRTVRLRQALLHNAQHDGVGHEASAFQILSHFQPGGVVLLRGLAQHIAGRKVGNFQVVDQPRGLSPFSGAGGTEKN